MKRNAPPWLGTVLVLIGGLTWGLVSPSHVVLGGSVPGNMNVAGHVVCALVATATIRHLSVVSRRGAEVR